MRIALLSLAAACIVAPALAQPLPEPASYPPVVGAKGVITTHELSLDMAEKIARAGIEQCRKMGYHTTITVLDASGALKAFLRDDMTGPHTISLSKDKAYTAITLANRFASSGTFATARNSTLGSPMTNIQGVVGVAGGVPIKFRGEVIGGIGSSGAVGGDKDELCSKAGIDAAAPSRTRARCRASLETSSTARHVRPREISASTSREFPPPMSITHVSRVRPDSSMSRSDVDGSDSNQLRSSSVLLA